MKRLILFLLSFAIAIFLDGFGFIDVSPYTDCAFWSALAGLAGGLFGGIMQANAQSEANQINQANNRNTNMMNYKIHQEDIAYNKESRDLAYKYQTGLYDKIYRDTLPANVRKQYQQAGINPYFAMGNIQPATAQASTAPSSSAPSGAPMQSATVSPVDYSWIGSTIQNSVNSYFNNNLQSQNAKNVAIDNITKLERQRQELENLRKQGNKTDSEIKKIDTDINRTNKLLQVEYDNLRKHGDYEAALTESTKADVEVKKLEVKSKEIQNQISQWQKDFLKQHGQAELKVLAATANNLAKQGKLYDVDALVKAAQEKGIKIDNYQKNKINYLLREQKRLENKALSLKNRYGDNFVLNSLRGGFNLLLDSNSSNYEDAMMWRGK